PLPPTSTLFPYTTLFRSYKVVEHLRSIGVDEEILTAILGHAEYTGTPRTTPMANALFAVDELAGFIVACCKVRPNGIGDLEPSRSEEHTSELQSLRHLVC